MKVWGATLDELSFIRHLMEVLNESVVEKLNGAHISLDKA
jgi:hypothetical protein